MNTSTVEMEVAFAENVSVTADTLSVELSDGRTLAVPLAWYPRLLHASTEERQHWRFDCQGTRNPLGGPGRGYQRGGIAGRQAFRGKSGVFQEVAGRSILPSRQAPLPPPMMHSRQAGQDTKTKSPRRGKHSPWQLVRPGPIVVWFLPAKWSFSAWLGTPAIS